MFSNLCWRDVILPTVNNIIVKAEIRNLDWLMVFWIPVENQKAHFINCEFSNSFLKLFRTIVVKLKITKSDICVCTYNKYAVFDAFINKSPIMGQ